MSMSLLAAALAGSLPTEVMGSAHKGFQAIEIAVRLVQHTTAKLCPTVTGTLEKLEYQQEQFESALADVQASRKKWERHLQD